MWQCPKCGKDFKNTNQHHFCGKINTIDEYIAGQPAEIQPVLQKVRTVIRGAAPDAEERMSWQMPTFWQGENIIHFAAHKKHLGLYPGDMSSSPFAERLADYRGSKGSIQFAYDKPIDFDLIADITRWRIAASEEAAAAKKGVL